MAVEVKPSGAHGKKKWDVWRDGKVVLVCSTNSEACLAAAELAKAEEDGEQRGTKAGAKTEKRRTAEPTKPPVVTPPAAKRGYHLSKKVGKKK